MRSSVSQEKHNDLIDHAGDVMSSPRETEKDDDYNKDLPARCLSSDPLNDRYRQLDFGAGAMGFDMESIETN